MSAKHKTTQEIYAVYTDRNYDFNYEKVETFGNGKKIVESIDNNEDGLYEEFIYFNFDGNKTGRSVDSNQDGLLDTMVITIEGQSELTFTDKDANGLYELKE